MRFRAPTGRKQDRTIASAIATFWCITVVPGTAPMIRPTWSPAVSGIVHQPSAHARIPRVFHVRAYSATRSSAAAGMAPSEWLMRYVVSARIGKRSRYAPAPITPRAAEAELAAAHRPRLPALRAEHAARHRDLLHARR